jgi:hypothetical protein
MSSWFPLVFQSQAYLWGLAAALIPLVIHLSRSRRTKKIRFSTTRFFTDQFLRSYRMSRLREILLLACRMLLFALFATALAAPLYAPKGKVRSGGSGRRAVVLVLDNSASMDYVEEGVRQFDRARKAAGAVLDSLHAGDSAGVVLAARRAAELGPEVLFKPTEQIGEVRQGLEQLAVAPLGTNLTAAIARAETLAAGSGADSPEVWVFSDLQEGGWELGSSSTPSDSYRVSFNLVSVRPANPVNRAVTAVRLAATRPMVGVPFVFLPRVSLAGDDADDVKVRLFVDDAPVSEKTVDKLGDGRWAVPRFHHTFASGGWHSGWVEVDDPKKTLTLDNRRYFAIEVLDQVKVLAVNGAPSQEPALDELFFLRLALTAGQGQKRSIEVDTVTPAGLASVDPGKYRLVILANVEALPPAAVEKLEDYTDGGGSLLVFLGDRVDRNFYNETLAGRNRRHGGLLPASLVKVEGNPAGGKDVAHIGGVLFSHPALAPFEDPRNGTLLGSTAITFKAFWRLEEPQNPDSTVLMRAGTQDAKSPLARAPLLCEKAFGKGRVMLFSSTCDRDWTNFPIRPVYLPWTHQLVAYLALQQRGGFAFHEAGALLRIPAPSADPTAPVRVRKPDGKIIDAERGTEDEPVFLFNEATQPGIYTVLGTDAKTPAALIAVNLDRYESDLTYLDDWLADNSSSPGDRTEKIEEGFRNLLDRQAVNYIADPEKVSEIASSGGRSRPLWDYFLIVVLILGLVEPWLANHISARLYGKARAAPEVALPLPAASRPAAEPTPTELVERLSR